MNAEHQVFVQRVSRYETAAVSAALPASVFDCIRPGDTVILKPNWVMEGHKYRPSEWEYVITHPAVITAVLSKVVERCGSRGRVVITDGPTTEASFRRLIGHYPVDTWYALAAKTATRLEIIDLREHEWETRNDIITKRYNLPGDPRGKTEFDLLDDASEFWRHRKSRRGYHGADYDRSETNWAHDGHHNRYSVSRTVIEADVFVNLPKLKTHRKAGITCCLKNLVGINTYKNFLPHHSEGGPAEGGDQFPIDSVSARIEGPLMGLLRQHVLRRPMVARLLSPFNTIGKKIFGDTRHVIRSGNWYGNDTIWRMILDLNKLLLYGNPDGTMKQARTISRKRYIGIVDAILAGEGHGPLAPEPVEMGCLVFGSNPVAIDATCAGLMGFDWGLIPVIDRAFKIHQFPICDFGPDDVCVNTTDGAFGLDDLPASHVVRFEPQFGWKGHIERADTAA